MVEPCVFPFDHLFRHDKSIVASNGYGHEFTAAISFLAEERIECKNLVTKKIGLTDVIEKGFNELSGERRSEYVKILVSPTKVSS